MMETEEVLEHPDISSQDSPMKTYTSELNTLKRHFPTVKSVNGESPVVNNTDFASVVNTIKAVSAACQEKDREELKINSEADAAGEKPAGTSTVSEKHEENKVNGSEQTEEIEPENKRLKVSIDSNDIDTKAQVDEDLKGISDIEKSSLGSNDKNSLELEVNLISKPDIEGEEEPCSVGKSDVCSMKEDCNCGEETELSLRIEPSPVKEVENHSSDLENRNKPENCFTPVKNHQCLSEEARKSPFLIDDKIRNSLKGIVEKIKFSPDRKRNLNDNKDKLPDQDKGYYKNEKVIAQDLGSPNPEMNDSATKVCDNDDQNDSKNIPGMSHVQSKNIENDNDTENSHIPEDSVRLKDEEQELLLGVDMIEDDTHMEISSDKEDELLQESASDTELINESVVFLGEEINGHETSDLKSKDADKTSVEDPQSVSSGNSIETDQEKLPNELEPDTSSKFAEENSTNSNDSKFTSDSKSVSDSNFEENSNDAVEKDSDDVMMNESSSDSTKEVYPTSENANNNSESLSEQSTENVIPKAVESPNVSQMEEDDIIFEGYDSPKSKPTEESQKDSGMETDASVEKSSTIDNETNSSNDSTTAQNANENKVPNESLQRVDSDVCLLSEPPFVESDSNTKSDKEETKNIPSSIEDEKSRNVSTPEPTNEKIDDDSDKNNAIDRMEEDDDDDVIVLESPVSEKDIPAKNLDDDNEVLNGKESVSGKIEESNDITSDTDEKKDNENKSAVNQSESDCALTMSVDRKNDDDEDDDDVIFEGEDKPNDKQPDQSEKDSGTDSVSELREENKTGNLEKDRNENKDMVIDEKNQDSNETKMAAENEPKSKSSLKRPAETSSDQNSNPKRTRLDEVIGKLGTQIGVEPESIEVSESEDEEEESATDTAEKSEGTATSDNDDEETASASDSEKVKYIRITEKQLEDLIQERVAAYLATQRETLLGQMTQRMKNVQISNDSWKDQVKELQVKVTDVTVLNLKHEKRKAATAALKQITTRSVAIQVGEGKAASASKQSSVKSEPPPSIARTPPRRPQVQQKSPVPLVTAPPGSNGTIRLPIPQSSIAPPVLAPQMPQLPQAAVISTAHYQTPSVKSLLDTTKQQITSGSLTKTTPATTVQYPQRVLAQTKTGYVTVPQSSAAVSLTSTAGTMTTKAIAQSPTGLKVIDLTMDEADNRQTKMVALPPQAAAQMQSLNQLRPVMQQPQQFVLNQNGQLIQTSPVGSTGQPAFQLVFNSSGPAMRASIPPAGTVLQSPPHNVTMTSPVRAQQMVTQVPGQPILRPQSTSSTQITSLLSQTKTLKEMTMSENGSPQSKKFEEQIRPALRKKLETTVTVQPAHAHPAPLPTVSGNQPTAGLKALPPKPSLKISRVSQGIVLSWNMTVNDSHAEIASYQLFAYQEGSTPPTTSLWKKVGDVKALPLPMACTLTQFQVGNKYHFAVRAVDNCSRVGQFSEYSSIHLTPEPSTNGKS